MALIGALVCEHAVMTGWYGIDASAETTGSQDPVGKEKLRGRDILVAGAGAVADGRSPARITIDLGKEPVPATANLELLLSPVVVSPEEPYFVVVSASTVSGQKRLGTVSFFPARPGAVQSFYFNASPILAEAEAHGMRRIDLSIALAPAQKDQSLAKSSVRIVGARLLEG
jgi:hypothetical protein